MLKGKQSLKVYFSETVMLTDSLSEAMGSCWDHLQKPLSVFTISEAFSCGDDFSVEGKVVRCKQCKVAKWCNFHSATPTTKWTVPTCPYGYVYARDGPLLHPNTPNHSELHWTGDFP